MSLPYTRNTTYTPGSPIYSVDLNAIQDCIIGGKRGEFASRVVMTPYFQTGWTLPSAAATPWIQSNNATNQALFILGTESGDQLRGLLFDAYGAGGGTVTAQVSYGPADAVTTGAYFGTLAVPNGVWTRYRADSITTNFGSGLFVALPVIGETDQVSVQFASTTVGVRIANVRPILARP